MTADVTYAAKWEAGKTNARRVPLPTIPKPDPAPADLNTGHKIDVRFTVLYVGDEFNIGYNYGSSEKTKFVCQYKTNHSDTAYNNHTIAISDIKAAASRASVNSGYQIVGWSKESNANPTTWSLNKSGTTACNKGTTIYLVAKNPNPTTKYTYTLNYDANGGTGAPSADSWSTTDAAIRYHSFTVKNTIPTREGYVFKGWKANDGSDTIYTGGMTCAVSQYGNDVVKNGNTWTRTLYAVWEEDAPAQPTPLDEAGVKALLGENAVQIICTNTQISHGSKTFGLIDGTFTVHQSNNRCEVVINSFSPYVNEFNAAVSVPAGTHITDNSMAGQNRTKINLVWSDGKWAAADAPAKYHVLCSSQPAEPTAPGEGDLENIEKLVRIVCDRNIHDAKEYGVIAGSCEFGDIDMTGDVPTCPVTIQAAEYVKAYNGTIGVEHTITGDTERLLILAWDANNNVWRPMTDTPVTFTVICPPAKPGAEDLAKLEAPVEVVCTTKPETHAAAHFSLGDGTYTIGDVAGNKTDGYTCDITVTADRYVWWYNLDYGKHTLTGDNTKTLTLKYVEGQWAVDTPVTFPVECETEPETTYTVTYTDGVENEEIFADQVYGNLLSGTATPAFNGTPTRAGYKFLGWEPTVAETVTENATYVAQWEKLYTVTYTDGVGGKAFKDDVHSDLEKDTPTPAFSGGTPTRKGFVFDGWNPEVAETVTEDVTYTAQWKPVQPDKKAIEGAIGRGVTVVCDNQNVKHGAKAYKVTLGEYTVSDVMGTAADGYTCTVTVRAAKFIEKYSSDMGDAVHTLIAGEPAEKTIELKWNGEKWVAETELPVTFHTLCPPEQPSKKDIEGAIGRGVKIVCDNQNVNHWGKDYKPTQGEYTVSDVTGTASEGYTCTITVKAAKIIEKYSSDMGKTHALIVGEQAEKAVELKWNGEKWVAKTELPITFHVECPPEKPTYDELKGLGINAKVDCTTTTAHSDKSYTLIEGTYDVSDPERKGTAYTCILIVNAKDYVAKYNAEENVGSHTLDDRDSKTIELTWNGEKWTAAETSVTFNVKCELLTVTYTDGVKGEEVFADVVYKDIPYGTSTPAFGTKDPTREGYKFVGWEPEVAETVTKDVTYTAKWEKLYTVTYTDGVKGKAFKDQVYKDLESGTDTPKFDGKPTRKGYTFTGWSPKVTDTVTKDVTYVAQWKSVKNGKDNIPKTGDSDIVMVLGSVLLFSFCGAAAVSVYDRKRKHF